MRTLVSFIPSKDAAMCTAQNRGLKGSLNAGAETRFLLLAAQLQSIRYITYPAWFNVQQGSADWNAMKNKLRVGDQRILNIYR